MRKALFLLTLTLVLALATGSAWADAVTGLTTFSSGTPAIANSVNANFAEVQDSVDDNDTRITALEGTKSEYLNIPGSSLIPVSQSTSYTKSRPDGTLVVNDASSQYFTAPINLPNGATITGFSINGLDNDSTYQFFAFLKKRPYDSTVDANIADVVSGTTFASGYVNVTDSTISDGVVDNVNYIYYVDYGQNGTADQTLYTVRITYTY